MLFSAIDILDENFEVHSGWYVGTKDGVIAYIGAEKPQEDFGDVYDGNRKLLMTGLVNAHTHMPMTLLRGYAENLALNRWLNEMVFPFEAKITDAIALPATQLAIAEMLRFGTVSCSDMYYNSDARAQAILESGFKCNMSHGLIEFGDVDYATTEVYRINEHLLRDYHNAGDGRLKIDLCLHAEYTTTPMIARAVAESAKAHGVNIHIHLSETHEEHEECKQRHGGLTPARYFDSLGVFDQPTTAAHCVWLEGEDFAILADKNVTVASCPTSNMKLGSGFADATSMYQAGTRVALGTDGVASNNNHNLFKDLYTFSLVQKGVTRNPVGITPVQALEAATINGALSQVRPECGRLKVGNRADLIVLDTDVPWMQPVTDIVRNVVYSAQGSDVCLTMVDGKVLYKDGDYLTIDVEKAAAETQAARDAIVASL